MLLFHHLFPSLVVSYHIVHIPCSDLILLFPFYFYFYLVCLFLSLFNVIMFGAPELWWWGALANLLIWFDMIWPFNSKIITLYDILRSFPKVIEHFGIIIRFWVMLRINRQTDGLERATHARRPTSPWVIIQITFWTLSTLAIPWRWRHWWSSL